METQNPIALQHAALESLIKDMYGQNIKSFLIDAAEIVEGQTDHQQLIDGLWECALRLPQDHLDPK